MDIVGVLTSLAKKCREGDVQFLIIGGWALNAHGVSRQTLDVDILVQDVGLHVIESSLAAQGYEKVYQTDLFAKFRAKDPSLMDVDCLFTDERTVQEMLSQSQATELGSVEFRIPSLLHLIAMKLHALKHNANRRYGRDMPDIIELMRVNGLDARDKDVENILLSFGTPELYSDIVKALSW